ncbi:hypothetical protein L2750_10120 [Shewanella submarina]|uniref:GAF domain-containing protein n=1 Tax=Shewanella submarina TaxID=2016376 RepID=A0ABV7GF08_9GAMM|nr:hypothetical protein [Shewanella submarina]MCL1037503.1 hypothetical protein [Shewanella submarina]
MQSQHQDILMEALQLGDHRRFLSLLEQCLHQAFDISLFTLTAVDKDGLRVKRLYSSAPDKYAEGGYKPIPTNHWTEQVMHRATPFIANTQRALAEVFFDHGLIASMGLGAVINYPVVYGNSVIGTVNLLAPEGAYLDADLSPLSAFYPWLVLAFINNREEAHYEK